MKITNITHNLSTSGLPAEEVEVKAVYPLALDLQFFADENPEDQDDDDSENPEENEEDEDDTPDLDELLKNPKIKAAHEAKLQKQLDRRLKKYKDVDPVEYKRLKAAADKSKGTNDTEETPADDAVAKKLEKVETREKKAAVRMFATEKEVDPVLLERFINLKEIELDEDGEPENLEDLFDDLMESKYAKYFAAAVDDDEDPEEASSKKKTKSFSPGNKQQKLNKKQKVDPAEIGKAKALERHKKKE